ncbi:MAG: histidine phosphatase family protein [Eudoraea sp.]|nr:histidine phosphatase family protein [Eudoraea sp.]
MKKQLILIRHGKSSWEYEVSDKDRPLKQRGIRDGHLVAAAFKEKMPVIDAVYSSPANRALHTCMIIMRDLAIPFEKLTVTDGLYDFSGEGVMDFVNQLDPELNCVLIFGHNFAFTNVANQWGSVRIDNVPTSGLVQLQSDVDEWKEIRGAKTVNTIFPKYIR